MKNIPLTKIGFFNPGRLSDAEIEQMFITRIPLFNHIFQKIIEETPDSIPQHYLIVGQRGMGKTSLLMRIAAELRKKPYSELFIALTFPEEQYNVDRLSKFWLNCLDALADALDKENNKNKLKELDEEISQLSRKEISAMQVAEAFRRWTKTTGRRPILLVDNLNLIFSKINKEEQHQLRALLMEKDAPVLVGASANTIEETVDYSAPFYDAFQINYLKKLSFEESLTVLTNLAKITGNEEFENKINQRKGRLEALHQLTGGTPRTLAILFPLIHEGFSENIQTDLDALLDVITPLYKARFEELAEQLQIVLDAVALHWDPATLEQLRSITQLDNQQLSPQLKRLADAGWLVKLDAYNAKGGAYELTERFFNIWYLMRRSSRRQKKELYCLTKFLESFYGTDLHLIAKERVLCKSENINQVAHDLALADAINDLGVSKQLKEKSYEELFNIMLNENENVLNLFEIPNDVSERKINDLKQNMLKEFAKKDYEAARNSALCVLKINEQESVSLQFLGMLYYTFFKEYDKALFFLEKASELPEMMSGSWSFMASIYENYTKDYTLSEQAYKKVVDLNEKPAQAWNGLGNLYQKYLGRYTESEDAYKKAIHLDRKFVHPWNNLGTLYQNHLSKYAESEDAYKKAISLDGTFAPAWYGLGILYQDHLGKYAKSEDAFKKAISLDETLAHPWNGLGNLYKNHLHKYAESEDAYKKAISLDRTFVYAWNGLGNLYQDHLGKYTESEDAYKRAISLDPTSVRAWNSLGNLYQDYLDKYAESEDAYKKAISLDPNFAHPWNGLGNLYQGHFGKYAESEEAYKKAISLDESYVYAWNGLGNLYQNHLRRYAESEEAYKRAISLDAKTAPSWNNLATLYQNHLGKYAESEDAYKKAISLDESFIYAWNGLGALYQDHLGRYAESEDAYKKAISLDETLVNAWNGLGNLYQTHLGKYAESEKAYKKAISLDANFVHAWNGLGGLYQDHLGMYSQSEKAYKKAITLDATYVYSWNGLGNLYQNHLGRYAESEEAYKKALSIDITSAHAWNGLGNLYQDHLGKFDDAEKAYLKSIDLDEMLPHPKYNLVFLWRDKMGKISEAKKLFSSISRTEKLKDSYLLHQSLFSFSDKNIGEATHLLQQAVDQTNNGILSSETKDDWYRSAAIIIQGGYGDVLLEILQKNNWHIEARPFYVAIEALTNKKEKLFLNSIAVEVREPALKIMNMIKSHLNL